MSYILVVPCAGILSVCVGFGSVCWSLWLDGLDGLLVCWCLGFLVCWLVRCGLECLACGLSCDESQTSVNEVWNRQISVWSNYSLFLAGVWVETMTLGWWVDHAQIEWRRVPRQSCCLAIGNHQG